MTDDERRKNEGSCKLQTCHTSALPTILPVTGIQFRLAEDFCINRLCSGPMCSRL